MKKRFAKNPDFVQREVAGESILVPIKRNLEDANSIYVLNEVGATIWKYIDGNRSLEEIKSDLLTEFDVSGEELEEDLKSLVEDLSAIQAIQEKAS